MVPSRCAGWTFLRSIAAPPAASLQACQAQDQFRKLVYPKNSEQIGPFSVASRLGEAQFGVRTAAALIDGNAAEHATPIVVCAA